MRYVTFDCGFSISPAKKLLMCSDREMAVLLRETGNGMGMNGLTIECPSNPGVGIFFVVTVVNFICFDYFDS